MPVLRSAGAIAYPIRQPVTEYDFEIPEIVTVRSAIPGSCGIDLHAVPLRVFVGDGAAEPRRAPRDRVLMEVAVDRPVCRRDQLWGRREVRHALREVDAAHLAHDPRHLADDGLREPLHPLRDPGRAHAPDAAFVKRWAAAPRWRRPASLPEPRASTPRV